MHNCQRQNKLRGKLKTFSRVILIGKPVGICYDVSKV